MGTHSCQLVFSISHLHMRDVVFTRKPSFPPPPSVPKSGVFLNTDIRSGTFKAKKLKLTCHEVAVSRHRSPAWFV